MRPCIVETLVTHDYLISSLVHISRRSRVSPNKITSTVDRWCNRSILIVDEKRVSTFLCSNHRRSRIYRIGRVGEDTTTASPVRWTHWPDYATLFQERDNACAWPARNKSIKSLPSSHLINIPRTVAVLGGFVDNFWHASIMLNMMCEIQDSLVDFLVQSNNKKGDLPSYFYDIATAIGIHRKRILFHRTRVTTNFSFLALEYDTPWSTNWKCLHEKMPERRPREEYILLITRPARFARNGRIFEKYAPMLAYALTHRTGRRVVFFDGSDDFHVTRFKFEGARIVVGPHGSASTNLIFSHPGTASVEFHSMRMFRPWLMHGGASIGMSWWPVVIERPESPEILRLVDVVDDALARE